MMLRLLKRLRRRWWLFQYEIVYWLVRPYPAKNWLVGLAPERLDLDQRLLSRKWTLYSRLLYPKSP